LEFCKHHLNFKIFSLEQNEKLKAKNNNKMWFVNSTNDTFEVTFNNCHTFVINKKLHVNKWFYVLVTFIKKKKYFFLIHIQIQKNMNSYILYLFINFSWPCLKVIYSNIHLSSTTYNYDMFQWNYFIKHKTS